jgi:hypothetical protein
MRTVMGVMAQKGAINSRLFQNLMGADAGDMGIGFEFENFHAALSAFHEARQDPMLLEVTRKRWEDPAGDISGFNLMRDVYEPMDITAPVMVVRTYQMSRKHLPEMIDIVKEIDSLSDNKVTAMVPVQHSQMDRIHGIYHFDSLADAGKYIDEVGLSPRFQELVNKANELGALVRSGMNIKM